MAQRRLFRFRSKRPAVPADHYGGLADGGLAMLDPDGRLIHMTSSRVAGSLRFFVARVQLHDPGGLPSRLAVTAALAGEGVTYVTRSLASVIAYDSDVSIAVVDLNWRRPADKRDNGGKPEDTAQLRRPALVDAVEGDVPLDDIIEPTMNPRLSLVRAGEAPLARRPALAASPALTGVLEELEKRFDLLLLDLPPVLASSEAMNLLKCADSYVLVVRQGATSESQVEAALEELQGSEALGVILNRFDSRIPRKLRRLIGT